MPDWMYTAGFAGRGRVDVEMLGGMRVELGGVGAGLVVGYVRLVLIGRSFSIFYFYFYFLFFIFLGGFDREAEVSVAIEDVCILCMCKEW